MQWLLDGLCPTLGRKKSFQRWWQRYTRSKGQRRCVFFIRNLVNLVIVFSLSQNRIEMMYASAQVTERSYGNECKKNGEQWKLIFHLPCHAPALCAPCLRLNIHSQGGHLKGCDLIASDGRKTPLSQSQSLFTPPSFKSPTLLQSFWERYLCHCGRFDQHYMISS